MFNLDGLFADCININVCVTRFTEISLEFSKSCIPNKKVVIRTNDKVWYDSIIRSTSRKRDRLRKKQSKQVTQETRIITNK